MKKVLLSSLLAAGTCAMFNACSDDSPSPLTPSVAASSSSADWFVESCSSVDGNSNLGSSSSVVPGSSASNSSSSVVVPPNSATSSSNGVPSQSSSSVNPTSSATPNSSAVESSSSAEPELGADGFPTLESYGPPPAEYTKDISATAKRGWNTRYWDACKPHCSWLRENANDVTRADTSSDAAYIADYGTARNCNIRDVEVEVQIQERLSKYPVPEEVWAEYSLDQEINDRGIRVDRELVKNAILIDEHSHEKLIAQMADITGLENPGSVQQLKGYLAEHGVVTETLGKKAVAEMLESAPEEMKQVLRLRQQTAKSSIKKYQTMERAACSDDRIRGMFQFLGAPRTGRFAGRLVQLQNLKRNSMPDLAEARELVRSGNYAALEMLYDSVPEVLSELVRTALVPKPGYIFYVADFSAVEARCLSFLAKEQWRIDSFAANKDIYCESASKMFHCKVEKHGENAHLRQRGKISELALGYGGAAGALRAMGSAEMGLQDSELPELVSAWRTANPRIVDFWWAVDAAAMKAVRLKTTTETHGFRFIYRSGMLFITLPSGRTLSYVRPRIGTNQFGNDCVTYMGLDSTRHWSRIETYGPKICENITQAICRDILCYAMQTLQHCFICAHVHDELIIECREDVSLEAICEQMGRTPPWIPGLLLRADGYRCNFYQKD